MASKETTHSDARQGKKILSIEVRKDSNKDIGGYYVVRINCSFCNDT